MSDHILLPGHVSDEYEMADSAGGDMSQAMAFRAMVKALDPYLDLIWVRPGAVNFPVAGRWYIVRWHPGGNPELNTYWVVENPDGTYTPPDDRHMERLRQMDSHSRDVYEEIRQRRTWKAAAKRKEFDATRQAFRELLEERISHLYDAHVAMPHADKIQAVDSKLLGPDGEPVKRTKVTV